jgi:hypothetical protein
MRDYFLALVLVGCTPQAGSDCPPVPQVGQPCSKEGIACLYGSGVGTCTVIPEYKCQNGRWEPVDAAVPPFCTNEGGLKEGGDARSDAGSDAPSDATSSSDG